MTGVLPAEIILYLQQEEKGEVIEVNHLTKQYGDHVAVSDLSFKIESGGIYGLLGPNGAGKSTTMNIITGCLAATQGHVLIGGHDIFEEPHEAKQLIGYLPELPPLYPDMTPCEYLVFVAKAKGVAKSDIPAQLEYVISVTQLEPMKDRLIKNLSKGYRQRVGIAQALLGEPELIILDEPTVGLDPKQIIEIRELIRDLGKEHTVILSSHNLAEVRTVCDHIMIISHGDLVASDTPDNLERQFAGSTSIRLQVRASAEEVAQALCGIEGVESHTCTPLEDGITEVVIEAGDVPNLSEAVSYAFYDIRKPVLSITTTRASLEEVFLELTQGSGSEDTTANAIEDAAEAAPESEPAEEEE